MNLKFAGVLTSMLALAGGSLASSHARIGAQSIIVNPVETELKVDVRVNKGGENPTYRVGEPISVSVSVNQDAYVYLFSVYSDGTIDLILPNRYSGGENFLRAGQTKTFPGPGATFTYTVGEPAGQDKVLAVASKRELNTDEIYSFQGNQQFATVTVKTEINLARALSIVVEPVPQTDWVTDIAYYQVVGRTAAPPAPTTGSIAFGPNLPQGAQVYVNGDLVTRGANSVALQPGTHEVRVVAPGYRDFRVTVTVRVGQTLQVAPRLVAIPREGTLTVRANIPNALVFVNGSQVGRTNQSGTLTVGKLPVGQHEVVVVAPNYRTFVAEFSISAGVTTTVQARLDR